MLIVAEGVCSGTYRQSTEYGSRRTPGRLAKTMSLGCSTALLLAIQLRANLVERRKVAPFGLYTLVCFERAVPSAA
jgi:hypothetical protein